VHPILALDIGGTNFSVGIFKNGRLVGRATEQTDRRAGPQWMLERMYEMVRTLSPPMRFRACGIGFGGPVDFATQKVIGSTQVPGWDNFALVEEVQSRFSAPTVVDRDTVVAALGEGYYGAGKGMRPIFYVTLSTGVGGGLLTEHGPFRGANSYACELGHHTVLTGGPLCLCGSFGCMERMCSGLWLERDHGKTARELLADPEFVAGYVVHLAQGLKNTIMFLNPARIILGGGISRAGDALFLPLRKELGRIVTSWSRARIDVVPAALVGDSVLWGAMQLASDELGPLTREAL
jgi:glucokinase